MPHGMSMMAMETLSKTIDALGTESVFTYNKNDQLISTDLHRVDALNGVDSHEITLYRV